VEKLVWDDEGEAMKNPEYEEAEKVWANGQHLEAIQLLRDYLKRHPREQYVALRIAEIYEKELQNHLAAALEYEEILKKRLPPERWGWAAIHLANLYSGKLNKPDEALALLRRIDAEFGQTAAAKKARERLASFETQGTEILNEAAEPNAPVPENLPGPKLPPGFRLKS
jgi:predicted Zn-dependent protease